jgi:Ca-activated chloride channel family protein
LGIGSRDGAPVPLAEGGFMKDAQGGMLLSRLDVKALWDLTQAGGGLYHTLDQAGADVDAVLTFIDRRAEAGQDSGNAVNVDQWREGGVWLLPLLLPLAALAFRRGWLGLVLLLVLSPLPQPAEALEWQDLWLTPDQQAQRKLAAGDAKAAAEQFQNPDWKAAAEYRAGNFEQSAKALDALPGATAHYNRGNALARQGQLEAAIKAYDQALKQAPQDEDARYNRQLVADALKQQQAQQKQDKDKQDHASDGKDQGDQKPSPQKDRKDGKDDKSDQKNTSPQQQDSNQQDHQGQQDPNQNQQDDGSQSQSQPGSDPSGQQDTKAGEQHQGQKQNPQDGQDQNGPDQPSPDEPQDQAPQDEPQGQASQGQQGQQKPPQQAPVPQPAPEPPAAEPEQNKASPANPATSSERQQAEAQWLRRIPDDPGGLLKRKFYYQYRQRQQQQMERKAW